MSKKEEGLIIDTTEIDDDENILFLTPNHIRGVKYCALNIFDYASIKNCPTEKLNTGILIGIFNSLKPGAEIFIVINQPISIMLEYDSKQIEANLRLVGFENIKYEETSSYDNKNGIHLPIGTLTATKPANKEYNVQYENVKSEKQYSYRNKNENKRDEKEKLKDKEDKYKDKGGHYMQKKVYEEIKEETYSSRYNRRPKNENTNLNIEKNEKEDNIQKKYKRFSRKEEEEDKNDSNQNEAILKEEKTVRSKRFGYSKNEDKEEKPEINEIKTEIIKTRVVDDNKSGEISSTTKEVENEKKTVVDKKTELENKKAGLRRRYGKH